MDGDNSFEGRHNKEVFNSDEAIRSVLRAKNGEYIALTVEGDENIYEDLRTQATQLTSYDELSEYEIRLTFNWHTAKIKSAPILSKKKLHIIIADTTETPPGSHDAVNLFLLRDY